MEFPFDIPEQEPGDEEWGSLEKWHPFWKKAKSIIEKMKEHAKQADSSPGSLVKEGPFKALLDELDALVEQVRIKGDKNRVYQWIEKNSEIVTKEGKKCELRCVGPFGLFLYDVDGWAMKEVEMKRRQGYKNFLIPGEEPN